MHTLGGRVWRASRGIARDHVPMSPTWVWMQIAIVVLVLIAMVIGIVKLA